VVVARNKVVSVTYRIRDQAGAIVEVRDLPVDYVHGGASALFPKIEQALESRHIGDRIEVTLTPAEGFGEPDPKLKFTDDLDNAPPELRQVGMEFEAQNAKGEAMLLRVTHVGDGKITVDANHPLAGKTLTFDVTVVAIRDASAEEIRTGQAQGSAAPLQ
jgi:FKBP-type peptidyl-prolyl cis-trans isomerase SlyD